LTGKAYLFLAFPLLLVLSVLASACGGGDNEAATSSASPAGNASATAAASSAGNTPGSGDTKDVEDAVRQVAEAGPTNTDVFLAHLTDNAVETFFGFSRTDCRADPQHCIGDPGTVDSFTGTSVDGATAQSDVVFVFGGKKSAFHVKLVRDGGTWKVDDFLVVFKPIPAGVTAVDLKTQESSFTLNQGDITSGNIAFAVENLGKQRHEVAVEKIPVDLDVEKALHQSAPEGVTNVGFAGPFAPGQVGTVILDKPLVAGRYLLVCLLADTSDPAKTPHAFKGMWKDFTVK
jgi:hypothetical protein